MASQPVVGGEEEVGRLGHPVLARPHRLDVPHQQPVEGGVEQQHAHAAGHGQGVTSKRAHLGQGIETYACYWMADMIYSNKLQIEVAAMSATLTILIFLLVAQIRSTHPNVVPLGPNTHLLVEGEVGAAEAKGNV